VYRVRGHRLLRQTEEEDDNWQQVPFCEEAQALFVADVSPVSQPRRLRLQRRSSPGDVALPGKSSSESSQHGFNCWGPDDIFMFITAYSYSERIS
jgi:hypothetical protein